MDKIRLHGFNNLTKTLSFNIYDICYACSDVQNREYMDYIDEVYNADRLTQIVTRPTSSEAALAVHRVRAVRIDDHGLRAGVAETLVDGIEHLQE